MHSRTSLSFKGSHHPAICSPCHCRPAISRLLPLPYRAVSDLETFYKCRSRVKVWFIKNYMSPQMRAFVPRMAAQYGFDYEFVTYKWPSWLHKQVSLGFFPVAQLNLLAKEHQQRKASLKQHVTSHLPVVNATP